MPDVTQRVQTLENGQRMLMAQSAEVAVTLSHLDDRLQKAVASGLREILADEDLMDELLDRLRSRLVRGAAERTGLWLWESMKGVVSKGLIIGLIVLLVGQFAGLAPAKAVFGWLVGKD